jgi:REP element-mobilizing transposase RayT
MSVWNDTDIPLAHLITFRSYGTWLHGDERGSVDRYQNVYGTPRIPPNPRWQRHNVRMLNAEPVVLNAAQRGAVEAAVRETCVKRNWLLRAINVRTNHIHIVVSIGETKAEIALNAFKANATRQMREAGCWLSSRSPWVDKGSKRKLWNERSIERAIDYVINGQGDDLPDFD